MNPFLIIGIIGGVVYALLTDDQNPPIEEKSAKKPAPKKRKQKKNKLGRHTISEPEPDQSDRIGIEQSAPDPGRGPDPDRRAGSGDAVVPSDIRVDTTGNQPSDAPIRAANGGPDPSTPADQLQNHGPSEHASDGAGDGSSPEDF